MPPPIAARMAVTIDSISHGRFGVNIISGWQRRGYTQMGILPGSEHDRRRYDYCTEYVSIVMQLWETGRSDFKGTFFRMDDCRLLLLPTTKIPIICAEQSDAGTRSAARSADYIFCANFGFNAPTAVAVESREAMVQVAVMTEAAEEVSALLPDQMFYQRPTEPGGVAALVWASQDTHGLMEA